MYTQKEFLTFHESRKPQNNQKVINHSTKTFKHVSECFIKPKNETEESSKHPYLLTPWELPFLSLTYIQTGLLFAKPSNNFSIEAFLERLKLSLSNTLSYFYPLAGRLATGQVNETSHECVVFVDCNKGPGVKFTYVTLDMTMSDILLPTYVPPEVHSFFDQNRSVNHDGHTQPLLSIQVTELSDGIFIGISINHAIVDGTSFWHFWNMWSEIHRTKNIIISSPPIYNNHLYQKTCGLGKGIPLPFIHPDEFITRYERPSNLKERFFHFSSDSIARLKAKANEEMIHIQISSFQALTALVWRSIVRAKQSQRDEVSHCGLAINNRVRLDPPLPQAYFGNPAIVINATATAGELLDHNLGWVALLVNQCVASHTNEAVLDSLGEWLRSPYMHQLEAVSSSYTVLMMNSPRFDMYGNEFGLGKPLAVRSGWCMNKFPGAVLGYPGYEGGGSVDLEICLPLDTMKALELDHEFMAAVSSSISGEHGSAQLSS